SPAPVPSTRSLGWAVWGLASNSVCLSPQMESACVTIHEALNAVIDSQTHYRLREAQDRSRAEDLNGRVSYWSVGETLILFVVSIGQVMLLKSFFTEKRPGGGGAGT
uniref:GOLD domain-containing protein n=1 Tax=Anas zonorhyncha TaxID=75864 RepID=A0A8B9ULH3_9AVES